MAEPTYSVRVYTFRRADDVLRSTVTTVAHGQTWEQAKRWRDVLCQAAAKRGRPRPRVQLLREVVTNG